MGNFGIRVKDGTDIDPGVGADFQQGTRWQQLTHQMGGNGVCSGAG